MPTNYNRELINLAMGVRPSNTESENKIIRLVLAIDKIDLWDHYAKCVVYVGRQSWRTMRRRMMLSAATPVSLRRA